jgi:hypothetical protein
MDAVVVSKDETGGFVDGGEIGGTAVEHGAGCEIGSDLDGRGLGLEIADKGLRCETLHCVRDAHKPILS